MIKIPVIYTGKANLPDHLTALSAGMDLRANIFSSIILQPLDRKIIPTGLSIALPQGYEAQVRPRSGLAAKYGVTVLNSPGTIDADYRGDIGVILVKSNGNPLNFSLIQKEAQEVLEVQVKNNIKVIVLIKKIKY
jgi:dUTP pyrophosphatase